MTVLDAQMPVRYLFHQQKSLKSVFCIVLFHKPLFLYIHLFSYGSVGGSNPLVSSARQPEFPLPKILKGQLYSYCVS